MFDPTNRGFLSDPVRDVLSVVGIALAIIPLLPMTRFKLDEAVVSQEPAKALHPKRLSLLPIVLALSLPVAVVGWIFRQSGTGEAIFVVQYFLSYLYTIGVLISVSEILATYGYSVRIFALLGCSLAALIAAFGAAAAGFAGGTRDLSQLSLAAAIGLATLPVLLGTAAALLFDLLRLMWKAF
jgi:hypothetical protein